MQQATSPLAVTMGEPAGVGGELTLHAYAFRKEHHLPPFIAFDDPDRLRALAERCDLDVPIQEIESEEEALSVFHRRLPVFPIKLVTDVIYGKPDQANAFAVQDSIRQAVQWVKAGDCAAVITNPIHKATMQRAGFKHPGHTEYLAELAKIKTSPVMMLASPALRVVPLTVHTPLRDVPAALTVEKIVTVGSIILKELKAKFGIAQPRLAVSGLNPHAGEDGKLGEEEINIIKPAIAQLQKKDLGKITGPLAADMMFTSEARQNYDCALCMYHDQALIPLKTLDVWNGVNITLGLPFIRTSPDHGTALDIAGQNTVKPDSFIAAMHCANKLSKNSHA